MSFKLSSLYSWYKKGDSTSSPVRAAKYKARGDGNFYVFIIDALDVNERDQTSLKSLDALKRITVQQLR